MKKKRVANTVLAISAGLFVAAMLFFIVTQFNNSNGFLNFGKGSFESETPIEEYLYYDIESNSAKLYVNFTELPNATVDVTCKSGDNNVEVYKSVAAEVLLQSLLPNRKYNCEAKIRTESTTYNQSLGYFKTKSKNYLNLKGIKADAYDVSFNVVFRASWSGEASRYLVTKTELDRDGQLLKQTEQVFSDTKYLDNQIQVAQSYQYEIRAISGTSLGDPVIFKVKVNANQRLEDIMSSKDVESLRILDSKFIFDKNFAPKKATDVNAIDLKQHNAYVMLDQGLTILKQSLEQAEGLILAGELTEENVFEPEVLYDTPERVNSYIVSATLTGTKLFVEFNVPKPLVEFYSPDGNLAEVELKDNTAQLSEVYPYINIKIQGILVKIRQSSNFDGILYNLDTGALTWSSPAQFRSFLVKVTDTAGKEIYNVVVGSSSYRLEKLTNLDKVNVEVLGYPMLGSPVLLGKKTVTLPERSGVPEVEDFMIEKAGTALALSWTGDSRNEHQIQISPRGTGKWTSVSSVTSGVSSYILESLTKLNTGNYDISILPSRDNVVGEPYTYECYLKVEKNKNYQILCE